MTLNNNYNASNYKFHLPHHIDFSVLVSFSCFSTSSFFSFLLWELDEVSFLDIVILQQCHWSLFSSWYHVRLKGVVQWLARYPEKVFSSIISKDTLLLPACTIFWNNSRKSIWCICIYYIPNEESSTDIDMETLLSQFLPFFYLFRKLRELIEAMLGLLSFHLHWDCFHLKAWNSGWKTPQQPRNVDGFNLRKVFSPEADHQPALIQSPISSGWTIQSVNHAD